MATPSHLDVGGGLIKVMKTYKETEDVQVFIKSWRAVPHSRTQCLHSCKRRSCAHFDRLSRCQTNHRDMGIALSCWKGFWSCYTVSIVERFSLCRYM